MFPFTEYLLCSKHRYNNIVSNCGREQRVKDSHKSVGGVLGMMRAKSGTHLTSQWSLDKVIFKILGERMELNHKLILYLSFLYIYWFVFNLGSRMFKISAEQEQGDSK